MVPLIFTAVIVLDQLTKHLVRSGLALGEAIPAEGFFQLVHVQNTGAAFGILDDARSWLIALATIAFIAVIWLTATRRVAFLNTVLGRLTLGLIAGGILGNLIDRIYYGYVTDFLKAGPWPVFNIADSAITIGVVVLAWALFVSGRKK
jgi:signal peptidase II